jgi:hypothetical protein
MTDANRRMFLAGLFAGAVLNELWKDIMELLDLYREQR